VKQTFLFGAEDAPIMTEGATEAVNAAQPSGDNVVLDFRLPEDHGAFIACLVVGGEDNPDVDTATWDSVFVPLIRTEHVYPIDRPEAQ
jgi:hypothetical protein